MYIVKLNLEAKIIKINDIVSSYKKGETITYIAKLFKISTKRISNVLKDNNVKVINNTCRKYDIKQDFFDIIDSPEKAYFLGLLYADGSVTPKKYTVSIGLSEKDKDILEVFKKLIYTTKKPLALVKPSKNNKILGVAVDKKPQYLFRIYSKRMCDRLIELGCIPRKTYLCKFPNIKDNPFIKDFIRGFFDGDGHIGVYKGGKRSHRKYGRISFVGTLDFLIELKSIIDSNLDVKCYITKSHRTEIVKELRITRNKDTLKFLDWLYERTYPTLKRKYQAYLELKKYESIPLKKRTSNIKCVLCGSPQKGKGYCSKHYEALIHTPLRREKRRLGLINY